MKGDDKAAIEAKTEALMAAGQTLGEKVYAERRRRSRQPARRRGRPAGTAGRIDGRPGGGRRQRRRRGVQGSEEG